MDKFNPTKFESITGSLPSGIASNALAIFGTSVTPLAAFVPFLLQSLATGRHAKRVDQTLNEINVILQSHENEIKNISDQQYKLINEVISSIFQTVDIEKLQFLKAIVKNTITSDTFNFKEVDYISRIIRDISIDEIKFIIKNFKYQYFFIGEGEMENALFIEQGSNEEIIVSGLINMGLLYSKSSTWDSISYEFSPVVGKLITILKN